MFIYKLFNIYESLLNKIKSKTLIYCIKKNHLPLKSAKHRKAYCLIWYQVNLMNLMCEAVDKLFFFLFYLLLCEFSFCGTLRFFMSFSMELEEADCLELWCLKQLGYFLSRDCSLLGFKHKGHHWLKLIQRET